MAVASYWSFRIGLEMLYPQHSTLLFVFFLVTEKYTNITEAEESPISLYVKERLIRLQSAVEIRALVS